MVFPPPPPEGPSTWVDANIKQADVGLRCQANWDMVPQLQEVFASFWQVGSFSDGANVSFGFNIYWLRQDGPSLFTVMGPDYRTDGTRARTDDVTQPLWIHWCQLEMSNLTGTTPMATRLDHLVDITPAARASLSALDQPLALWRGHPPIGENSVHSGWVIDLADAEYPTGPAEQIPAAELARTAPALCAALALPAHHLVITEGNRFRGVWHVTADELTAAGSAEAAAAKGALITWPTGAQVPTPQEVPTRPSLETISHQAHGKTFIASVDPEYRGEALEMLRVVDQRRGEELVDNFALSFGFNWLIFRQEGDRMRMKCTDFTVPGIEATTADLTQAAQLRRDQIRLYKQLGKPKWTDVRDCLATMRVYPGALDLTQITMRRNGPTDSKDSGWVFGTGPGEPEVLPAHEVHWRAPHVAVAFPLPVGFEVTITGRQVDRVVDNEGAVRWSRTADAPRPL